MRNLNKILLAVLAALAVGCAEDKDNASSVVPFEPYIPTQPGPGLNPGTDWEYGATADLDVTYDSMLFYLGWTPNQLDVQVNINLQRFEPANGSTKPGFGGTVSIGFNSNGNYYEDTFSSLINENHWYGNGMVKSNRENHKYNVWFTKNGQLYYHGFFQDRYGSVIIVIDENNDEGDGQGPTEVSGSIWVMNFGSTFAPVSPTSCWFVSLGPYDCRTWKDGDAVDTEQAIYPYLENDTNGNFTEPKPVGYRKLGDFSGLNFQDAFNGEGGLQ